MDLDLVLQRCRMGDELAWEALVRSYQSRVFGIAYHYVGNREEARDLSQEIFIRIYRNMQDCPKPSRFVPWMIRISRNACVDHLRRGKARPPVQDVPAGEARDLCSRELNPEERWTVASRRNLLYTALQGLGEISRQILLLKEIQGLSIKEISSRLGLPMGTVKSRSHRARVELIERIIAQER